METRSVIEETKDGSGLVRFFHHPTARMGEILLNRPQKLNSVTKVMFAEMHAKLKEWKIRDDIQWILWHSAEPVGKTKAFSAGGELSEVVSDIAPFIGPEYVLDHYISTYPKPQIALWDGIVMGAGYGLTGHAQIRIATEYFQFAMPEARFGLIADIGCAYLLTRQCCDKTLGTYLTLTADRIRGIDEALWAGLATHSASSSSLSELKQTLLNATTEFFEHEPKEGTPTPLLPLLRLVCDQFTSTPAMDTSIRLKKLLPGIRAIFGLDSVQHIYEKLQQISVSPKTHDYNEDWIKLCLYAFETDCCPMVLCANFELMRRASNPTYTYADSLIADFRAGVRLSLRQDIKNGADAILNKTERPTWSPASVLDISNEDIEALLQPLSTHPAGTVTEDLCFPTS